MNLPTSMLVLCLALAGCASEDAFPVIANEPPQAMQQRYLDWNARRPGWQRSASGLEYRRVGAASPGGAQPSPDSIVTAQCEGRFVDGRLFFATTSDQPLNGPLKKLIKGWQEGLQMMHAGETWEFAIPGPLAYGEKGWVSKSPDIPSIPPQTTLLFKITLLAVSAPAQT
jgi:FKBP-type peptidyl-prolyl cis-trans isomerase FkpA